MMKLQHLKKKCKVDLNNIVEDLNQYLDDPELNGLVNGTWN